MAHLYTAICENPFCLYVSEGIEAWDEDHAWFVANSEHGEKRPRKFKSSSAGMCPGSNLTIGHDFPCPACLNEGGEEQSWFPTRLPWDGLKRLREQQPLMSNEDDLEWNLEKLCERFNREEDDDFLKDADYT